MLHTVKNYHLYLVQTEPYSENSSNEHWPVGGTLEKAAKLIADLIFSDYFSNGFFFFFVHSD